MKIDIIDNVYHDNDHDNHGNCYHESKITAVRIPINSNPGGGVEYDYDGKFFCYDYDGGNDDYDNIFSESGGGEQDHSC